MYDDEKELSAGDLMWAIRELAKDGVKDCDPKAIEVIQRFKRHMNGEGKYLVFYYP